MKPKLKQKSVQKKGKSEKSADVTIVRGENVDWSKWDRRNAKGIDLEKCRNEN